MLSGVSRRIQFLWLRLRRLVWRRPRPKLVVEGLKRLQLKIQPGRRRKCRCRNHQEDLVSRALKQRSIRVATFNAALFSLAPAVPRDEKPVAFIHEEEDQRMSMPEALNPDTSPVSILKGQFPILPTSESTRTKPVLCTNLPGNEILLAQNMVMGVVDDDSSRDTFSFKNHVLAPVRSPICFPAMFNRMSDWNLIGSRTILDVLKEVDADILALQDVKAVEEKDMEPLSALARGLDMSYVFSESWAPEYGNAVLSKWPIKRWTVQKICDDNDFRNVVKATIDVPWSGELNFYCTQLDHLDENWRMKQIRAIIESNDQPHLLAGGLNSLDASDYSSERWDDIVKYYEELGKPTPKVQVTSFLKQRHYTDAQAFAGECGPLVITAQGQNTQGTCKYGTRVDYILGSPGLDYTFVPGSYSVYPSKGSSDHHIVKVEITRVDKGRKSKKKGMKQKQR